MTEDIETSAGQRGVRHCWHVITSEFPPQLGGVSDYTGLLAAALGAHDDDVHIWCPACAGSQTPASGVSVHRELGSFSWPDLQRISEQLDLFPAPRRLLVQWVPHGYGYRSMNLAFCWWVWQRARRHGDRVELMVHEPNLPFRALAWRQNIAALVHRVMTVILLHAASRVWISIPGWEPRLRPYIMDRAVPFRWLPIFSNVPVAPDSGRIQEIRRRFTGGDRALIGHFGTYGAPIAALLQPILVSLAGETAEFTVLLMGHGSEEFKNELIRKNPRLADAVQATGKLSPEQLSFHLAACDILIQPYPDGVSTRRTSFMAGLSHGKPVVTTSGELTEPLWNQTDAAVIVPVNETSAFVDRIRQLLKDPGERSRIGCGARKLYNERFDISHAVAALRETLTSKDPVCAS